MLSPVSMANVSRVHFGDNALDRQGAYAKPADETAAATAPADEKKSNTGKKVAIGAGIALVVLATLVGLSKGNVLKVLDEAALKEAKWYSPKTWGHYLAKAGNWIAKYTYDPIAKLCGKKGGEAAADAVAGAESAATSIVA